MKKKKSQHTSFQFSSVNMSCVTPSLIKSFEFDPKYRENTVRSARFKLVETPTRISNTW